ncbi:MAG: hypothetical protein RTU63_08360 [Candidatus Thorarchaeota archaeon]
MSNEENIEEIDHVLDLLSKPISRYILSVLAGVDPGTFKGTIENQDEKK